MLRVSLATSLFCSVVPLPSKTNVLREPKGEMADASSNKKNLNLATEILVPVVGVEPTRPIRTQDFKSCASAISPHRLVIMEAPTRFELVIKVLQTLALPLGDGAVLPS